MQTVARLHTDSRKTEAADVQVDCPGADNDAKVVKPEVRSPTTQADIVHTETKRHTDNQACRIAVGLASTSRVDTQREVPDESMDGIKMPDDGCVAQEEEKGASNCQVGIRRRVSQCDEKYSIVSGILKLRELKS